MRSARRCLPELSIFDSFATSIKTAQEPAMPSSYVVGEHFEAFIKSQIQQGRYASASEVIRDGLRALEDREKFRTMKLDALRAEIQQGAESGPGKPAEDIFNRLEAKYEQMARERSRP